MLKICGEKLSSNEETIDEFYENFKRKVMESNLSSDQIYNCNGTAPMYKNYNDKTDAQWGERPPGRKKSKEKVAIMPLSMLQEIISLHFK